MRYKIDALREINTLKNRLQSQRKTAMNTPSAKTAKICDAVIASLEKQLAVLEAEMLTLPERPQHQPSRSSDDFKVAWRTTPLSSKEEANLEIPDFLRRSK